MDRSKVGGVHDSKTCTAKKMRGGGTQAVAAKRLGLPSINNITSLGDSFVGAFSGRLITINSTSHSAICLCSSATSQGPEFDTHHESTYCDMANKQTCPLCIHLGNSSMKENCFNIESKDLIPPKGIKVRDTFVPTKEYHTVTNG